MNNSFWRIRHKNLEDQTCDAHLLPQLTAGLPVQEDHRSKQAQMKIVKPYWKNNKSKGRLGV
jgi:hypothetical protein